eukprot:g3615.t1
MGKITQENLDIMDTLLVPDWSIDPKTGDYYPLYNRPASIAFWLKEHKPKAEWTLILHPDIMFRQQITISDFNLPDGYAASSYYKYLTGVNNALAARHLPHVKPIGDLYGGPKTRRADQAGPFIFIRTRDLLKLAPKWLDFTVRIRSDSAAWNLTGDAIMESGKKPWLAEMYGYAFAAANISIWHKLDPVLQSYPGFHVKDIPSLLHYGVSNTLGSFSFDKRQYTDFKSFQCPPWTDEDGVSREGGLFPHPPAPSTIKETEVQKRYGNLMIIEFANNLNKALCLRHKRKCVESEELTKQCEIVDQLQRELEKEFSELNDADVICQDDEVKCKHWVEDGECEKNWLYMVQNCRRSCGKCKFVYQTISRSFMNHTYFSEETKGDLIGVGSEDKEKQIENEKVNCLSLGREEILKDSRCRLLVRNGALTDPLVSSVQQELQLVDIKKKVVFSPVGFVCIKAIFLVLFCLGIVLLVYLSNQNSRKSKTQTQHMSRGQEYSEKRLV